MAGILAICSKAGSTMDNVKNTDAIDREIINLLTQRQRLITGETAAEEDIFPNSAFQAELFSLINRWSERCKQKCFIASKNPAWGSSYRKMAYLGPVGTYSHQALVKFCERWGLEPAELLPCSGFSEQIEKVKNGTADLAFLPIENTSSGIINDVIDLFSGSPVHIIGEITLHIVHSLLVAPGKNGKPAADVSSIKRIYSHPQPIAQCSKFIKKTFPEAESIYCDSTADAAIKVLEMNDPEAAVIASEYSGKLLGLESLFTNIANQKMNYTRFIVVARAPVTVPLSVPAKTSLMFTTSNDTGSLAGVLGVFKEHGYNMTKLASRPLIGRPWEELFYADIMTNIYAPNSEIAYEKIEKACTSVTILGCYPAEIKD